MVLCADKTLFLDAEIGVSRTFHVSQNIVLIFFQLSQNTKTILISWAAQKQAAGQIWPVGCNLLALA